MISKPAGLILTLLVTGCFVPVNQSQSFQAQDAGGTGGGEETGGGQGGGANGGGQGAGANGGGQGGGADPTGPGGGNPTTGGAGGGAPTGDGGVWSCRVPTPTTPGSWCLDDPFATRACADAVQISTGPSAAAVAA